MGIKGSEVNTGYGKGILGPVSGSPVGGLVIGIPAEGRLEWRNVVLHNVVFYLDVYVQCSCSVLSIIISLLSSAAAFGLSMYLGFKWQVGQSFLK